MEKKPIALAIKKTKGAEKKRKDRKCGCTMQRSAGLWTLHSDDVPEDRENYRNGKYQETNFRPNE